MTFQRQKRAARTITSELLKIPGIGPNKRRALLHVFGSVQGVREAPLEAVAAVPGFGPATARRVLEALGVAIDATPDRSDPVAPSAAPDEVSHPDVALPPPSEAPPTA